ncbi:nuclear transport factor 2 family protein [Paraburkholderia hayleyella]|uniref:nuclear transport factor 2 family protein n=1 Tax=Paraburkholderia hayleyella TaxID=2152889 RepID=UPI0012917228|nr:nuclear transport factor 2 family protein [Paraburkholderia hayleyella]
MTEKVIDVIRRLERERFRAMIEGDGESLDLLLSDGVSYIHTNGKRETKQQVIDSITSGRRRYRQIEIQSQDVLPAAPQACIVTGRILFEMEASNGVLLYPAAYTALQVQEDGQWRLMAWQATRSAAD